MLTLYMQSAHESPSATASILSHHMLGTPQLQETVSSGEVKCADGGCSRRALPYSRYCLNRESDMVYELLHRYPQQYFPSLPYNVDLELLKACWPEAVVFI